MAIFLVPHSLPKLCYSLWRGEDPSPPPFLFLEPMLVFDFPIQHSVMLKKTPESLLDCKQITPVSSKGNQPRIFIGRTNAEAEAAILWPPDTKSKHIGKDPDAGKRLKSGEGDNRGWHGWMTSLIQWTWVWVNSWRWWRTGRPGVLWSMDSQRVRHDWAPEQQQQ